MKPNKPIKNWTLEEMQQYCIGNDDCNLCPLKDLCGEVPIIWEFKTDTE